MPGAPCLARLAWYAGRREFDEQGCSESARSCSLFAYRRFRCSRTVDGVFADDMTLLRASRADAIVASLPTIAYAGGAVHSLRTAAWAGVIVAVVVCGVAARRRPMAAVAGLLGVLLAIGIAIVTGRPSTFFLPGIFVNAVLAVGGIVSLAVGKPAFCFLLPTFSARYSAWRTDVSIRRVGAAITAVWIAVFVLRFVVMGACYLAGAGPSVLAAVKIVLGLPIAAIAAVLSWRFFTSLAGPANENADVEHVLSQS